MLTVFVANALLIKHSFTFLQLHLLVLTYLAKCNGFEVQTISDIFDNFERFGVKYVAVNEPGACTRNQPVREITVELLEIVLFQNWQEVGFSHGIILHQLWEQIQCLSIRLIVFQVIPVLQQGLLRFNEKLLDLALVESWQVQHVLYCLQNIVLYCLVEALPQDGDAVCVYFGAHQETGFGCLVQVFVRRLHQSSLP